jgi:hypothetical protein
MTTTKPTLYDTALRAALPCPFWSVAAFGCVPVLCLLLRVLYVLHQYQQQIDITTTTTTTMNSNNSSDAQAINELYHLILISVALSIVGYFLTSAIVPKIAARLLQHVPNLSGIDIGKRGLGGPTDGNPVAESLGIVPGTVLLIVLTLTATCARVGGPEMSVRLQQSDFNVAIGSITMAVLLGLVDDLVDLKVWYSSLLLIPKYCIHFALSILPIFNCVMDPLFSLFFFFCSFDLFAVA